MSNDSLDNFYSKDSKTLRKRYSITLDMLDKHGPPNSKILDLGIVNPLSQLMVKKGFDVINTPKGLDLDVDFDLVKDPSYDIVTAFEILEHLVSPFPLLKDIKADRLFASIPLKLWFKNAYWSKTDPWDKHYHEFEPRQFDMLLDKAGWKIEDSQKWKSVDNKIGIRPILRRFTDRYYLVYCTRK